MSSIEALGVLEQNQSNPFRSSTQIGFRIRQTSWTRLTVYDVQGREVKTLVDRQLEPGAYTETFDARDLPAGVYWVRMDAGSFSDSKKMTLLR
jgi:Secretion system C-terminal sorting domain